MSKAYLQERFHIKRNSFWNGFAAFFTMENPYSEAEEKILRTSPHEAIRADIRTMQGHQKKIFGDLELLHRKIQTNHQVDTRDVDDLISKSGLHATEHLREIVRILQKKYSKGR